MEQLEQNQSEKRFLSPFNRNCHIIKTIERRRLLQWRLWSNYSWLTCVFRPQYAPPLSTDVRRSVGYKTLGV